MTFVSSGTAPTPNAAKYVTQLCKHWGHNLTVVEDGNSGRITFPKDARGAAWPDDAVVTFHALPDRVDCRIDASAEAQRDGLKGAIERHVNRFAFREGELAFDWTDQ